MMAFHVIRLLYEGGQDLSQPIALIILSFPWIGFSITYPGRYQGIKYCKIVFLS